MKWNELTGGTVNHNSSKQLAELLFGKMALPAQGKTKSGNDSVDALTLQRLEPLDTSGIVAYLRGIRKYEKLIDTFITMLEEKPFDGFLHGNFNQTGTVTSRLSSSDPNQQNIPSRGELGKKTRTVFDAPDGIDLVVIDYSQIEMRVMANESKDENLLRAFFEGIDPHQMTADRAGVKRSEAKALNFGWGYGMSYLGLMDAIEKAGLPRPSAKDAR
jgi:DNA polymerase-1